jgi:hypothetical protein
MFLLHFRIFAEMMFFARAAKNQRGSGNGGGGLANTKVHSAPQPNRAAAFCARSKVVAEPLPLNPSLNRARKKIKTKKQIKRKNQIDMLINAALAALV